MNVDILQSRLGDNLFYLVHADGGEAALVDPVDAELAIEAVRRHGATLRYVLNTHHHGDHTMGNAAVLKAFPEAKLVAGHGDAPTIDGQSHQIRPIDHSVKHGDLLKLGTETLEVLESGGHTRGHVSYRAGGHLLCGDTLFAGGAGNCRFGGDVRQLFHTFRDLLGTLDGALRMCPGHDYSERNFEFALSILPDWEPALRGLEAARQAHHRGEPYLTTLEEERRHNLFLRFAEPQVAQALRRLHPQPLREAEAQAEDEGEAVFSTLRALRNHW